MIPGGYQNIRLFYTEQFLALGSKLAGLQLALNIRCLARRQKMTRKNLLVPATKWARS
jgi:hypothetical protein